MADSDETELPEVSPLPAQDQSYLIIYVLDTFPLHLAIEAVNAQAPLRRWVVNTQLPHRHKDCPDTQNCIIHRDTGFIVAVGRALRTFQPNGCFTSTAQYCVGTSVADDGPTMAAIAVGPTKEAVDYLEKKVGEYPAVRSLRSKIRKGRTQDFYASGLGATLEAYVYNYKDVVEWELDRRLQAADTTPLEALAERYTSRLLELAGDHLIPELIRLVAEYV